MHPYRNNARRILRLNILVSVLLVLLLQTACQVDTESKDQPTLDLLPTLAVSAAMPSPVPSRTPVKTLPPTPTLTTEATGSPSSTAAVTVTATIPANPTTPEGYVYHPAGPVYAPILMYHRVTDQAPALRYAVTVDNFRAQMQRLADAGYQTITVSELTNVIREGGTLPAKPVVITFDDGFLDVYENAFPIMQELGFTATMYIITGTLGTDKAYGYVQEEELRALANAGWEIGSHSISHSDLKTTHLGMRNEAEKSKQELEEKLGLPIRSFAYPYASANDWIEEQMAKYGYDSAMGVGIINRHSPESLYFLSRREVYNNTTLREFDDLLTVPPPTTTSQTGNYSP